jgi:hypothetical protein
MLRYITKPEFISYKLSPESTCSFHYAVGACLPNEKQLFLASSVPDTCSENSIEQLGRQEKGV